MNKIVKVALAASSTLVLASCSSDSGTSVPLEDPIGDISGGWSVLETFTSSNNECNGQSAYDINIAQNGNSITVTGAVAGDRVTGTLSGDALSLTGSRTEDTGRVTYGSVKATVPADCSSLNADTTWTYSEPGFSCTGTSTMEANRTSGGTTC